MQQVALAKLDKERGLLERMKPISGLSQTLHADEEKRAALLKEESKLANILKEQLEGQQKLTFFPKAGVSALGIFKPEEKKAEMKLDQGLVNQVFMYVLNSQQDQAGALLKTEPLFALTYGTASDPSGRTFQHITAFQYAVWARDWCMCEMMLTHFKDEHFVLAINQYHELDAKGTEHGKTFDTNPLIEALKTYNAKYIYTSPSNYERSQHWAYTVTPQLQRMPVAQRNSIGHYVYSIQNVEYQGKITRSRWVSKESLYEGELDFGILGRDGYYHSDVLENYEIHQWKNDKSGWSDIECILTLCKKQSEKKDELGQLLYNKGRPLLGRRP